MDKEAQERIAKYLCLRDGIDWEWLKEQQRYYGQKDCEHYGRAAGLILVSLEELGYCKLPKDKPPLLNSGQILGAVKAMGFGFECEKIDAERIAQAQREADIKYYEG